MPRYFINHVHDGVRSEDREGADYRDLDAAGEDAILSARELMSARVLIGGVPNGDRFVITDEDGNDVADIAFKDAIG